MELRARLAHDARARLAWRDDARTRPRDARPRFDRRLLAADARGRRSRRAAASARLADRRRSASPACDCAAAARPSRRRTRDACIGARARTGDRSSSCAISAASSSRAAMRRGARRARSCVRARARASGRAARARQRASRGRRSCRSARSVCRGDDARISAHAGAWLNLAAVELALGDVADAERDARHALSLAPGHPEGLLLLGHVLAAQRRYAEAAQALRSRRALGAGRCALSVSGRPHGRGAEASRGRGRAACARTRARSVSASRARPARVPEAPAVRLARSRCAVDAVARTRRRARGRASRRSHSCPSLPAPPNSCVARARRPPRSRPAPRRCGGSSRFAHAPSAAYAATARRLRFERLRQSSDRPSDRRDDRSAAR